MKYVQADHLRVVRTSNDDRLVVLSGFFRVSDKGSRLLGGFQEPYGQFVEVSEDDIQKEG